MTIYLWRGSLHMETLYTIIIKFTVYDCIILLQIFLTGQGDTGPAKKGKLTSVLRLSI